MENKNLAILKGLSFDLLSKELGKEVIKLIETEDSLYSATKGFVTYTISIGDTLVCAVRVIVIDNERIKLSDAEKFIVDQLNAMEKIRRSCKKWESNILYVFVKTDSIGKIINSAVDNVVNKLENIYWKVITTRPNAVSIFE